MWMMCFLSSHKDAIYTGLGFTLIQYNFSSVQFIRSVMSDSLQPHEPQHARPPCPSPTPGVHPREVKIELSNDQVITDKILMFHLNPELKK